MYVVHDEDYLMVLMRCQRDKEATSTDLYYLSKPKGAQISVPARSRKFSGDVSTAWKIVDKACCFSG